MLLAKQPVYRSYVQPGPCVLGSDPFKLPTPTTDRDQTVSRRFEPSSRTMAYSDHEARAGAFHSADALPKARIPGRQESL